MISSLILLVSLATAEDFQNVQKGEPAPFSGTLLKPEAMAIIIAKHDYDVSMCLADTEHKLNKQQIECELATQKIEYDFSSYKITSESLIAEKDKELDKAYELLKKQNKNLTPMWIGIGFAAGFITSIGTIYVYNNI